MKPYYEVLIKITNPTGASNGGSYRMRCLKPEKRQNEVHRMFSVSYKKPKPNFSRQKSRIGAEARERRQLR